MDNSTTLSAEELQRAVDDYFAACDSGGELYSEAGLALALDVPLDQLRAWYDGDPDDPCYHPIQMAYLRIMRQIECGEGYRERGMASLGAMKLKQRRFGGYQDKSDGPKNLTIRVTFGPHTEETDFD